MATRRIVIDLLAASTGGQLTRARAFLARLRRYDANSEIWLLQENDALGSCAQRPDLNVVNLTSKSGRLRALRRMAWLNLRLPALIKRHRIDTYISFSHYLPWTLPRGVRSVVGVSNLAPFSQAALDAETKMWPRLRLLALRRTILSATRRADRVIALSEACRTVLTGADFRDPQWRRDRQHGHFRSGACGATRTIFDTGTVPVIRVPFLPLQKFYPSGRSVRAVALCLPRESCAGPGRCTA